MFLITRNGEIIDVDIDDIDVSDIVVGDGDEEDE